jgi:2-haloacid dehalogenase
MNDIRAIAFDLYGTLCDVHSVADTCERFYPGRGRETSLLWRQKQLEYTWLRSLMGQYTSFENATEDSLVYTAHHLGLALDNDRRAELCEAYFRLRAFPEVPAALHALNDVGLPLAIVSNGSGRSIEAVARYAGIHDQFAHLISVEVAQVFKPDPRVYELGERALGVPRPSILFVSSNAWDVTGAGHYGFSTCWIKRGAGTFEELGQRPGLVVQGLDQLVSALK